MPVRHKTSFVTDNFYRMVVSVFKTSFKKQKPKIVTYRNYKRFDNEKFRESVIIYFSTDKNTSHDTFENLASANLRQNGTNKTKTYQRQPVSCHE